MSLNQKALAGNVLLILAMMALLFIPAGTLRYWQAWIFLAVFLVFSRAITFYLVVRDRELLARRMRGGPVAEGSAAQKTIMSIVSVCLSASLSFPRSTTASAGRLGRRKPNRPAAECPLSPISGLDG